MKRSTFFTSILGFIGIAKAQEAIGSGAISTSGALVPLTTSEWPSELRDPIKWHSGKALNGQCPTCGTMTDMITPPEGRSTLTRCFRCKAGFFIDSDK